MSTEQATPSIYKDDAFEENNATIHPRGKRIVGGVPTSDYRECVAVGGRDHYCCSGTLITPRAVLTAGHCVAGGCRTRIFIGDDITQEGREIAVREAISHPEYVPGNADRMYDDIAILRLKERVTDVKPVLICSMADIAAATTVRLVGYGNNDFKGETGYGIRRMIDVGVASQDPAFGARFDTEFVAGAPYLDKDTCTGDSGGPAYIWVDKRWKLAGATSRPTRNYGQPCGDGGVYTAVPAYLDWIKEIAGPLG